MNWLAGSFVEQAGAQGGVEDMAEDKDATPLIGVRRRNRRRGGKRGTVMVRGAIRSRTGRAAMRRGRAARRSHGLGSMSVRHRRRKTIWSLEWQGER